MKGFDEESCFHIAIERFKSGGAPVSECRLKDELMKCCAHAKLSERVLQSPTKHQQPEEKYNKIS